MAVSVYNAEKKNHFLKKRHFVHFLILLYYLNLTTKKVHTMKSKCTSTVSSHIYFSVERLYHNNINNKNSIFYLNKKKKN